MPALMPTDVRHPAAFIDRDGVINEERHYVHRIDDFVLLPGAVSGLQTLQAAGYLLVVVTNQGGIGRGLYTEEDFARLTAHMLDALAQRGIRVAAVYHCPHHPDAAQAGDRVDCSCRKPHPGMLLRAAQELAIDLARSVMIGDKASDLAAGRSAGVGRCLLVASGHSVPPSVRAQADHYCADLVAAAHWLSCEDRDTRLARTPLTLDHHAPRDPR
jgi:D-glycero-D-manno-heptose 1,7-bisphosphate phosphatase